YRGFAAPGPDWETGADGVTAGLLGYGQASALSGALTNSGGGHLYVGFNPEAPTKEGSFGGKVGFNVGGTDGVLELIDLAGDNLPDKVFKSGDGFAFRLNQSGPDGTTVFGPAHPLPTLPALSREDSVLVSGGAEAYVGVNALVNVAGEFTTESTYFSDVNGDGLPGLVQNGHVFFNHLVPDSNGVLIPTFVEDDSSATPVPVGQGAVDAAGLIADFEKEYQQQLQRFPLLDTLRRWVAPFDGQIQIAGT